MNIFDDLHNGIIIRTLLYSTAQRKALPGQRFLEAQWDNGNPPSEAESAEYVIRLSFLFRTGHRITRWTQGPPESNPEAREANMINLAGRAMMDEDGVSVKYTASLTLLLIDTLPTFQEGWHSVGNAPNTGQRIRP